MTTRTGILIHFDPDDISHVFRAPSDEGPGYASLDIGQGDPRMSATLFFDDTAAVDAAIRELGALKSEMLAAQADGGAS